MANVVLKQLSFGLLCLILKAWEITAITVNSFTGMDNSTCCNGSGFECKSLFYAFSCISINSNASSADVLVDGDASFNGKMELTIPKYYHLTIASKSSTPAAINCESGSSMLVVRSNGGASVSFRNIMVRNCGPKVPSAILIEGPLKATFENCTFVNNLCSGLNSRDASLTVNNSRFISNIANQSNSFDIDFAFGNTSLGGGLGVMFDKGNGNNVEIVSSDFMFGSAYFNKDPDAVSHDTDKAKLLANYYAAGGGLAVINTFYSKENAVIIRNCNFMHNKGTYGSGLFFTFVHNSTGNSILVQNCTVAHNFASHTGGGVLVTSWDKGHNNSVILRGCNIYSNNAMGGGAIKLIYNSIDPFNENRGGIIDFQMHDCNVFGNKAMSGSALRFLSHLPYGLTPSFVPKLYNCTISGHSPTRGSKEYSGAVLSTKLGIEFHGNNFLLNNTHGSAIHISSARIHVRGTLVFQGNNGLQGGAIYLAESSKIILYPDSYLKFDRNHADFRGGGIYVEVATLREVVYPFNPRCFLQYSEKRTPPSKWKAKVEFTNNSASLKGAALFLNSLVGCLWGEDDKSKQLNQTLRWANKITYSGNFVLLEANGVKLEGPKVDIATDTYDFIVKNSHKPFKVAPGQPLTLNMVAIDQLGNEVYSVPAVKQIFKRSSNQEIFIGQQYFVLPPGRKTDPQIIIRLSGSDIYSATAGVNDTEFIRIAATQSNFMVEKNLRLETQKCYPGFIFDGTTCVCDLTIPGLDRCSDGRYLYLKEGYWGGMVNGQFVTNICPRGYCKCTRKKGSTGCFYDFKKPDDFCTEGRSNILCGRCKDGLAVSLRPTECIDCSGTGAFLALSIFVVLAITILIICFNPNIPTDLRGILFYVQVLPYLFKPNDRVGDFVTTVSGIADLGRPTEYPLDTCAVPELGNLGTMTLNYVTPAEVIIILIVLFTIRRFLHFERSKPFQCFFVLLVLIYKYIVETSFGIIHCVDVGGKKVFFYDGSWECYQGFHLAFFIVSIIVIICFVVLPIILLAVIVLNGPRDYRVFSIEQAVIDSITEGLRRNSQGTDNTGDEPSNCSPCSEKLEESCKPCANMSESLWSGYVITERGWWWSVDFARRVVLVALYVFIQDWELKQISITIACSCIFALHCVAWPYKKTEQWANEIEAAYLFAMMILANVQYIASSNTRHTLSIAILILTYGFGWILFVVKAISFIRTRRNQQGNQNQERTLVASHDNIVQEH